MSNAINNGIVSGAVGAIPQNGLSRLRRIERAIASMQILAGGDVEPGEQTDAGMTLRLVNKEAAATTGVEESADVALKSLVLLRITGLHSDSPTSGVRMYKGNIYNRGSSSPVTKTGVTVRIPDIGPDVLYPSSGAWSSLPPCIGFRTIQTWIGKTVTHTNDVVYEALGLILMW